MRPTRLHLPCALLFATTSALLWGCGKPPAKSTPAPAGAGSTATPASAPHGDHEGHDHGDHAHGDHDHDHGKGDPAKETDLNGDHGPMIELGTTTIAGRTVKASRDEGPLTPGGEGAFDVWIDGDQSTILAVRIWVGTRDAKGSVKAKADPEHADHPEHRHTHAEIPSPLPAGSQLWVELEVDGGEKHVGAFDLTG